MPNPWATSVLATVPPDPRGHTVTRNRWCLCNLQTVLLSELRTKYLRTIL